MINNSWYYIISVYYIMSNTKKMSQQITKKAHTSKTRSPIRSNMKFSLFTTSTLKIIKTKDQESNTISSIDYKMVFLDPNTSMFIKNLKEIRQNIKRMSNNIKYEIKEIKIPVNKLNELKNSVWVSPELVLDNLDYEVKISWNNNNLYFKTTKEKFNKIKKRLPVLIKMMNYIKLQSKQQTQITIYYVLSDLKKHIEENTVISPKHINSGYTDLLTKEIFIWRSEEFEKISFHELIHLFYQDHTNESVSLQVKINGPKSFYEAVTDLKGIIYNIIYISLVMNIKIEKILKNELFFINNQAKMVLSHLNSTNCTQKSPAYSYFILKEKIFNYFTSEFADEKLFNDIFYKNINFNKLIQIIKNEKIHNDDFIDFNSARMTLYECE